MSEFSRGYLFVCGESMLLCSMFVCSRTRGEIVVAVPGAPLKLFQKESEGEARLEFGTKPF